MHELVRGYAAAVMETAGRAGELGALEADLSVFLVALAASDPLRNTLSDPSVPIRARRGVVADLLEGRASAAASALAGFATRIERAADLPLVIAQLREAAESAASADDPPDALASAEGASRLALRDRIRGYAERVLSELASTAEIDTVEDELFRLARIMESSPELRHALTDPGPGPKPRTAIVHDLLRDKVAPSTERLAAFVVRLGRMRDLVGTLDWLVEVAAAERGRRVAEVRSAVDLDGAARDRLAAALGRAVDRNVEVRVVLDPSVIGGAFVSVGDLVIDGTVRQRFERLRDVLGQKS